MHAEITAHTLELTISGVAPIKYDMAYNEVIGVRVSYDREEVTSLTAFTLDQDSKQLVPIAYRVDLQEMWEPWLRELVEQHRPTD